MRVRYLTIFDDEGESPEQRSRERVIKALTAMGLLPAEPQLYGAEREAELKRRIESAERATQKRLARGEPIDYWDLGLTPQQRAGAVERVFEIEERDKKNAPIWFRQMLAACKPFYKGLSAESREFLLKQEQEELRRSRGKRQKRNHHTDDLDHDSSV